MKKNILFFAGLFVAIIVVALVMAFVRVGLPTNYQTLSSRGFGGGIAEGLAPSSKMLVADQAMPSPTSASSATTPNIPRQVTKTGNLNILVDTAETAVQNIQAIAESVAGYVSDSTLYEVTPGVKAGAITIRVPADKFDQTLNRIKELAVKVESENVNANDVTEQFIDLEARLKNLKAQETQYLDILKKATKVEDVLNITNQLNQVRQQIDSWQGQLKYLSSQVDLSTITINLTAEKEVQIWGLTWHPITVIKQAVRSLLDGLVSYVNIIIAVAIYLPVILVWIVTFLVVAWIFWAIVRWSKNRSKASPKKKVKKTSV